jgi:hypothetical protein
MKDTLKATEKNGKQTQRKPRLAVAYVAVETQTLQQNNKKLESPKQKSLIKIKTKNRMNKMRAK